MITDPRRLLPGYTFTLPEHLKCFCWGCYDGAVLSAQHRWLGRVQACAAHHPDRAGIAVPFGRADAVVPPPAPAPDAPADDPQKLAGELAALLNQLLNGPADGPTDDGGGEKVRRRPRKPRLPPSGAQATLLTEVGHR